LLGWSFKKERIIVGQGVHLVIERRNPGESAFKSVWRLFGQSFEPGNHQPAKFLLFRTALQQLVPGSDGGTRDKPRVIEQQRTQVQDQDRSRKKPALVGPGPSQQRKNAQQRQYRFRVLYRDFIGQIRHLKPAQRGRGYQHHVTRRSFQDIFLDAGYQSRVESKRE
jgi:hypothetical protein